MSARTQRKIWLTILAAGTILPATTCVSTDTQSALADLYASTTGSVVELLVKDYLHARLPGGNDPNLGAPISEQQH